MTGSQTPLGWPPAWLDTPAELAAPVRGPSILVADIDDARFAAFVGLQPTHEDLHDRDTPRASAGPAHFLGRRSLMRHLLGRALGVAPDDVIVGHGTGGAPRLLRPQAPLWLSVGSRGPLTALAVSPRPVGIDIELLDQAGAPPLDMLHPRERAMLSQCPPDAVWPIFLRLWCVKEAYLKMSGTGFTRRLETLEVRDMGETVAILDEGVAIAGIAIALRRFSFGCGEALAACVARRPAGA